MFSLRYFDISEFLEAVKSHFGEFYFLAVCFSERETKGWQLTDRHWPNGPNSKLRKFHKNGLISPKLTYGSRR